MCFLWRRGKLLWNCLSSWCVGILLSASWYFFQCRDEHLKKQYFTTSCHFPSFQLRKTCVNFATSFTFVMFFPPFFPTNWFFGIHTPPHHNYLNEGKMDVYNDNFVAGGSVCAKLAVCFHGLFQDALLYTWRGSSLHYGKPMSEELFFHFFRKLFFSSPCLLRKSAARIFVHYINRQSFSRKKKQSELQYSLHIKTISALL